MKAAFGKSENNGDVAESISCVSLIVLIVSVAATVIGKTETANIAIIVRHIIFWFIYLP